MTESCGACGASTEREPLCEQCNNEANAEYESLAVEIARLRAENGSLHASLKVSHASHEETVGELQKMRSAVERLRAENAELRENCDLDNFLELKWFRRREGKIRDLLNNSSVWDTESFVQLKIWENDNPKPGAGT